MYGPYRSFPDRPSAEVGPSEERVLGWVLICLGGVRVAVALAAGDRWGAEVTAAALMLACGVRMLTAR